MFIFVFQAEDGIRDSSVTGVQTCALPICALIDRDARHLSKLIDENFDVRRAIYRLPAWQVQMVDVARGCGASANFAGSGGAIVGSFERDATLEALGPAFGAIGCGVITPLVA